MSTRVLIVDNNLLDLEAVKEALAEAGFDAVVEVALDAPEAIAVIDAVADERSAPELVLVDLRLSVGSGLDVVRRVRCDARLGDVPVAVMSGVLDTGDREACLAAGADRVDVKPRRFAEQVALAREWARMLRVPLAERRAPAASAPAAGARPGRQLHLAELSRADVLDLQDRLRPRLRAARSLEDAAQALVRCLCVDFASSTVLTRMFVTLPFATLPEDLRRAAWSVVERQALQSAMRDQTPVLTLLSTCGREPAWCDRRESRGHVATPLSSRSFVDSIPMIARMLQDMGLDLGLQTDGDPYIERVLGAGWVGLFYVGDALTARDDRGRRIIPAVDFVERYGVRTVFGLGKAYANGSIASLVAFTSAIVPRERVEALVPIMNLFKAETLRFVNDGAIFRAEPTAGVEPAA
ncbi:MAG TPA: response regulator [Planctomycetota bacterium]|nr:response regulator [Planctomycetota bacterium]